MSGRGTASGVVFQAELGAVAAAYILSERPLSTLDEELPGLPKKVLFETPAPVDDLTIETDFGQVYFQAKNTISLSPGEESELASVAEQFVRQFREGASEGGTRRDLVPSRDRLVLCVSDAAAGTISNDFRDALNRNRTGAATALPEKLENALKVFTTHIETNWRKAAGSEILPSERDALLELCNVVVLGRSEKQVAKEALRDVVEAKGSEAALFGQLEAWAAQACKAGVGGDAPAIRLALPIGVRLAAPPSYASDVEKLTGYTGQVLTRLKRFSELEAPEGLIEIHRPVANVVAAAARGGSTLITGEPGAGKSGVLYRVASELGKTAPVLVFSVDASAVSLDALRGEIALDHSLIEVIKSIPNATPGYLLLDALDAVRGGAAEATYRKLAESVLEIPGWHVVASVRTFDLKLGREWQRLFRGTPFDTDHADPALSIVKHVHIGALGTDEHRELASKSDSLTKAIAVGGEKLADLARNPFNLALLAELLCGRVEASSLAKLSSRGDLLERYWEERLSPLGLPATVSLKAVVDQMVDYRAIDLPETKVPLGAADTVQELQRGGVLVTSKSRRLGFRHHVLFDYAVAKLLLIPDLGDAFRLFRKEGGGGLVVAPSVGFWLESLRQEFQPQSYWGTVTLAITNTDLDPIIRVEIARLAVEGVEEDDRLTALHAVLQAADPPQARALNHLVGAIHTKELAKQPFAIKPWSSFLRLMTQVREEHLGPVRALIGVVLDREDIAGSHAHAGIASRALFDAATTRHAQSWLAPHVLPYIARTFGSDPVASAQRIRQVLMGERFQSLGYIEVPWLSQHVNEIAPHDPDLVVDIYSRVFRGGEFSREQTTQMSNSYILPMTSNAAQDFGMAAHSLSSEYPKLIEANPVVALRALRATLEGEQVANHPVSEPKSCIVAIDGVDRQLIPDFSSIWAWDIDEERRDDYAKVFRGFLDWLPNAPADALASLPAILIQAGASGLIWRALFEAGAARPDVLGDSLWGPATSEHVIKCQDTSEAALRCVAAIVQYKTSDQIKQVEERWSGVSFDEYTNPEKAKASIEGTLFQALGEDRLQTERARDLVRRAREAGADLSIRKPHQFRTELLEADWLSEKGVDVDAPSVAPLLTLSRAVEERTKEAGDKQDLELQGKAWAAVSELWIAADEAGDNIPPEVDRQVSHQLAHGLEHVIRRNSVSQGQRDAAIDRLLRITFHAFPEKGPDTDENFAHGPSWGVPAPRIEAAHALMSLVRLNGMWPKLRDRIEWLAVHDPHPAVRFQLLPALPYIMHHEPEAAWALTEEIARSEANAGNLKQFGHCLRALSGRDDARLEAIAIDVVSRFPKRDSYEDGYVDCFVHFAIDKGLSASSKLIAGWVSDFAHHEGELHGVLFELRDALTSKYRSGDTSNVDVRNRAVDLVETLIAALEPTVRALPQKREIDSADRTAFKLFCEVADQLYYAVGYGEKLPEWLQPLQVQREFLSDYAPLILKMVALGTPRTIHHMIEMVGKLVEANPELSFEIFSEAMLRTTGVSKYEYESMGAARFVELVGLYLADYKHLFDDEERRARLIECVAVFVEAGWPEARRLFQSLPELLR